MLFRSVRAIPDAPPLVHFALGALYQKADDHAAAARHLALALEENGKDEAAIVFPSKDLREYVRMLRRIERAPNEAPLTSTAVQSLERMRRHRGKAMLARSTAAIALPEENSDGAMPLTAGRIPTFADTQEGSESSSDAPRSPDDRKSISEVLHDLYDDANVQ